MAPMLGRDRVSRRARPGSGTYGGTPPAHSDVGAEVVAQQRGRAEPGSGRDVLDGTSLLSSSVRAWCRRWASSHLPGVVPVSAANRRAKVRSDIDARRASTLTGCSSARCSRIQVSSGARLSALQFGTGRSMYWRWPPSRCGGTTIRRAILLATAAPSSHLTWCRQASMPAAVPALVTTRSSSTNRTSGSTVAAGKRCFSSLGVHPVGGAGASVQQACLTEQERTRADREHPGSARVRPAEDVEHRLRGPLVVVVGGSDQQVRALGSVEPVGGRHRHAVLEVDRLAGSLGADAEVDAGYAVVGPVDRRTPPGPPRARTSPGGGGSRRPRW